MLDNANLDGVVVATPHTTHQAIGTEVLRRGIPLLLANDGRRRQDQFCRRNRRCTLDVVTTSTKFHA